MGPHAGLFPLPAVMIDFWLCLPPRSPSRIETSMTWSSTRRGWPMPTTSCAGGVLPFLSFRLRGGGDEACIRSGLWGRHLALPLAFAAAAGCRLGIPLREGAAALEGFRGIKGRGRILPAAGRKEFVVDDAYNANPLSMRSSLETFLSLRSVTPKMAVLGEMREMGPDAVRYHRELEPLIDGVDEAVLVGELWHSVLSSALPDSA